MPHQWLEGNLPVSAKCAVCDKTCGSVLRLQDWKCLWCKTMVRVRAVYTFKLASFPNWLICDREAKQLISGRATLAAHTSLCDIMVLTHVFEVYFL